MDKLKDIVNEVIYLYILLALFILVFIPFPIKFSFYVNNKIIKIYLYNKEIKIKKSNKKKKTPKKKKNYSFIFNWKKFLYIMRRSRFKPRLSYKYKLIYDTSDAYYTAILNGYLNILSNSLHNLLLWFFRSKKFKIQVNPLFKNEFYIEFQFKGIIYINFVKLIIIAINLLKCIKKEVSPLREAYEQ